MNKLNCDCINVAINLDELDLKKIRKTKDGKKFLFITVSPRKEPDNYGNNCVIKYQKTKAEREANEDTVYVPGNAKTITFHSDLSTEDTTAGVEQSDLKW